MKKTIELILISIFVVLMLVACEVANPETTDNNITPMETDSNLTSENTYCKHNFGDWVMIKEPTCYEEGSSQRVCLACKYIEVKKLDKNQNHLEVVDAAIPATCTKDGLSEGKHCSVCNTVIIKQEKIDALEHRIENNKALAPTCSTVGLTEGSYCRRCDLVLKKQEVIPKLEHSFVNNKCKCGQMLESQGLYISSHGTSAVVRGIGECKDSCIVIPSTYDGVPVTYINLQAFANLTNVEEVIIPESVTELGSQVFYNCKGLRSVTLSSGIERLPSETFKNCSSLVNVTLPKELISIGENCFSGCVSIKKISIPDNVRRIGDNAFNGCTTLKEIVLPGRISEIEQFAFYGCDSLELVYFMGNIPLFKKVHIGFECFGNNHPPIICIDGEYYDY